MIEERKFGLKQAKIVVVDDDEDQVARAIFFS